MSRHLDAREIREDNRIDYEHRTNVHYLPGAKAKQQAMLSAEALENDRRLTRMSEIEELLSMYETQRETLNTVMFTLANEYELLREKCRG
jgi:hypothetical protein